MRIAVYTCITNEVDSLIDDQPDGADYFLFSDKEYQSHKWKIKKIKKIFSDPRRVARYYKINSHLFFGNYDAVIWIDGTVQMLKKPSEIVRLFLKQYNIGVYIHPRRNCIYDEARACRKHQLDHPNLINNQVFDLFSTFSIFPEIKTLRILFCDSLNQSFIYFSYLLTNFL